MHGLQDVPCYDKLLDPSPEPFFVSLMVRLGVFRVLVLIYVFISYYISDLA